MGKIFAVGDIHGCLTALKDMMRTIEISPTEDTLIFLGDYIDRGPDSKGVVDYVIELRSRFPRVVCLLGNHERMFLDYLDGFGRGLFLANGGRETLASYGTIKTPEGRKVNVPLEHIIFFKSLLIYYETEDYLFVHAGLRPGLPLEKQSVEDMIWIRHEFYLSSHVLNKTVIYGHTAFGEPRINERMIGIDTGAVYGRKLTCLELPTMKLYQV